MPKNDDILTGRYQGSGRGFGFFIPDGALSRADDCFIPPHREGGAWDGDRVQAVLEPAGPALCVRGVPSGSGCAGPAQPGRRLAKVVAILERGNPTVTGVIRRENRQVWLLPDNERLGFSIKLPGKTKVKDGQRAAVKVASYGSPSAPPLGTLAADFGPMGSRAAAVEAILYRQGVERAFPDEVAQEAQAIPQSVAPQAVEGRLDLREELIITIDGAATKDIDDAVSLKKEGDHWLLGVHIADVSRYVLPGSALDDEAFSRGTSVYFADQVVPMLPVALSNGICSLNPGVDRLTLSCLMTLDKSGEVTAHTIAASVIRSAEKMTYEDCNLLLSGEDSPLRASLAERYAHILPVLQDMAALSRILEKRRKNRGSLDLETQESYILCDSLGRPVDVLPRSQGVSEKLIESFMLCANETVAKHLFDLHAPAVYRIHEKPSQDKLDTLRAMLSPLGLTVTDGSGPSLQKALDAVKDKPQAPAVSMMVLRAMMKARYSTENLGHFGLAAGYYCHFTSPIRRYPDLMVHRCLHALLAKAGARELKRLQKSCESAAVQSSQRELAAQTAERDIDKLYFADYMQGHIGETFPAAVSGATRFGLFAALPSGVEGFIPVETLPQDHYIYDEASLTLTGERTGRTFPFGMALEVICVSADPGTGRIEFRLPDGVEAPVSVIEKRRPLPKTAKPPIRGKRPSNRRSMHVPKRGRKGKRR